MPVIEMAARLHVSRQQLHRLLAEEAGVSPEMALRLGKFCGNGPEVWLALQKNHDLWQAEQALAAEIAQIETVEA